MGKRPTIADVAAKAGVSVSTVDRVLNRRNPVQAKTAERVTDAAESLGYHGLALLRHRLRDLIPRRRFGFLLQREEKLYYRQLAADIRTAVATASQIQGEAEITFVDDLDARHIAQTMARLGKQVDALAVVAVDHALIADEIGRLREAGIPTFALLTDVSAPAKAGVVAVDGRKAGRVAGWAMTRLTRRAGTVGVLVGSHRYRGHEDCEMGLRGYLREHGQGHRLLETALYLDREDLAQEVCHDLLERQPDLVGLHVIGGGIEGCLEALKSERQIDDVVLTCHDLTPTTRQALAEGWLDMIIAPSTRQIAHMAVEAMIDAAAGKQQGCRQIAVPHEILVSESL
ncbi:MAG: LacI family DNA-binding transcriptional regulator [Pseudomonadota bacterium]